MMKRHLIIGCFGPADRIQVPTDPDEVSTSIDLVASERRLDHGLGHALDDVAKIGLFPSEIGLDLLVLAALVHAADTRISRESESQDTWTREIRLSVPVSNLEAWTRATAILERMLHFLTGDLWTINFRTRPSEFMELVPERPDPLPLPVFNDIGLFSGGLDSLIGAIDQLEAGKTCLLISHAGDGATSEAQNACFEQLQSHYAESTLERLRVWMNFSKNLVLGVEPENTTRGRSFLFFTIGIFAGTGLLKPFSLRIPENGLIALNVPLDPLRLGALSTRTTHPFYMTLWNELMAVLGIDGQVENIYWNKTKGEMVQDCANQDLLLRLLPTSLSCSSPTKGRWQGRGVEHCGYCLPCLIRRSAIVRAFGTEGDLTNYTISDMSSHVFDTRQAEGQQVRSFQYAISRLNSNPALARLLIHKPGPLRNDPEYLDALADVYRRGMDEVGTLVNDVQTRPA